MSHRSPRRPPSAHYRACDSTARFPHTVIWTPTEQRSGCPCRPTSVFLLIVAFLGPLATEECDDHITADKKLGLVAPSRALGMQLDDDVRIARIPCVL